MSTSRGGRGSKSPARTVVAVRRLLIGGQCEVGKIKVVDIVRRVEENNGDDKGREMEGRGRREQ